jgi:hypothetical protein
MALTLWQDVERGLSNSEMDANFSELAAGTLAQSAIDNRPLVKPTIKINQSINKDPRLVINGSDFDLNIPSFNLSEGTFIIEHQITSGIVLLSNQGNTFLQSLGAGKIAISYTTTSSLIVFNAGTATVGSGLNLTSLIKIIGGVSMSGLVFKYYPKSLTTIQLQELTK